MRLGIGTYALAWNIGLPGYLPPHPLGHLGLLAVARQYRLGAVQFCDNLPLESLSKDRLDEVMRAARLSQIVLEPGARGLDSDRIAYLAVIAAATGAGFVRVVIDEGEDRPSPDEAVDRMRGLRSALQAAQVRLAIENHDRFPAETLAAMVRELGTDCYAVCLDTANSLGCLEGTAHVVRTLGPYAVNVHVKDIRVRRLWHNMGFEVTGTAAGDGDLDIPWILAQVPHAASATIEHWPAPLQPDVPPVEEELAMLERSVAYMRSILPSA